jgi:hypothetical protein
MAESDAQWKDNSTLSFDVGSGKAEEVKLNPFQWFPASFLRGTAMMLGFIK